MLNMYSTKLEVFRWEKVQVPMEYVEQINARILDLQKGSAKETNPRKIRDIDLLLKINKDMLERMEGIPWLLVKEEVNKPLLC